MSNTIKRKSKVIMLPTEKANMAIFKEKALISNRTEYKVSDNWKPQHLYILSDDEILENDYIYHILDGRIILCGKEEFNTLQQSSNPDNYGYKKIIATTDTSLNLSQPSKEFITKYIEEYKKGAVIEFIDVLYEDYECKNGHYMGFQTVCSYPHCNERNYPKLKVDKQNCITITRSKDSYATNELYSIMQQYHDYCVWKEYITPQKFIEQNL